MTVRLAVVVQHHPSRAELVERLTAALPEAVLVRDPEPDGRRDAWRAYRACLDALPADASHLAILQDDSIVCEYFMEAACAAIASHPDRLVSFFVAGAPVRGSRSVHGAAHRCEHWAELDARDWCPAVALCLPRANVAELLEWADARIFKAARTSDDAVLGDFVRDQGHTVLATVPSLVQHPDDVPSLIGTAHSAGRNPARVAACFVGGYDARLIDW
jgi:hypothetical protein